MKSMEVDEAVEVAELTELEEMVAAAKERAA